MAYFATESHFLRILTPGFLFGAPNPAQTQTMLQYLGLPFDKFDPFTGYPSTHYGYTYFWVFENDNASDYALNLYGPIVDDVGHSDWLAIELNSPGYLFYYGPCGLQDGVPALLWDTVTHNYSCTP